MSIALTVLCAFCIAIFIIGMLELPLKRKKGSALMISALMGIGIFGMPTLNLINAEVEQDNTKVKMHLQYYLEKNQ